MTDFAPHPNAAHLIELVLDIAGPVHAVEPLMRLLRQRLEHAAADGFVRQVGTHVSQEFGALSCTVRAVVHETDLLRATEKAVSTVRPLIADTRADQHTVHIRETALHTRLL